MINLRDIKMLSYEMPRNVMIVELHKPQNIHGINTKKAVYKVNYDTFVKKGQEWREYHKNN